MKAKELRLGNYAKDQFDQLITVSAIDHKDCLDNEIGDIPVYVLQPIPLSEEWLINFKLIESEDEEGDTIWNNENIEIQFFDFANENSSFYATKALLFQTEIELRYVHQLQNLYFAITGEELTIKKKITNGKTN